MRYLIIILMSIGFGGCVNNLNSETIQPKDHKSKWVFGPCPVEVYEEYPNFFIDCITLRDGPDICDPGMESCT